MPSCQTSQFRTHIVVAAGLPIDAVTKWNSAVPEGTTDFSRYAPGGADKPLQGDFFVPDAVFDRSPTKIKRGF